MSIPADDSIARFIRFINPLLYWHGKGMSASGRMDMYFCILAIYVVGVHFLVYVDDVRIWARVTPYDEGVKVSSQLSQRASGC
jgi:hypothetical protein